MSVRIEDDKFCEFLLECFFAGCALAGVLADTNSNVNPTAYAWDRAEDMMATAREKLSKIAEEDVPL